MFNRMKFVIAACALLVAGSVFAQPKVAVLNLERAILGTDAAKARLSTLERSADYVDNVAQAEKLDKEIKAIVENAQKNAAVMSSEQKQAEQQKAALKQSDLKHVVKKIQALQQNVARQIMAEQQQRARKAVNDLVKSEKLDLLLDSGVAVYAAPAYDVTTKVTKLLNAK